MWDLEVLCFPGQVEAAVERLRRPVVLEGHRDPVGAGCGIGGTVESPESVEVSGVGGAETVERARVERRGGREARTGCGAAAGADVDVGVEVAGQAVAPDGAVEVDVGAQAARVGHGDAPHHRCARGQRGHVEQGRRT